MPSNLVLKLLFNLNLQVDGNATSTMKMMQRNQLTLDCTPASPKEASQFPLFRYIFNKNMEIILLSFTFSFII